MIFFHDDWRHRHRHAFIGMTVWHHRRLHLCHRQHQHHVDVVINHLKVVKWVFYLKAQEKTFTLLFILWLCVSNTNIKSDRVVTCISYPTKRKVTPSQATSTKNGRWKTTYILLIAILRLVGFRYTAYGCLGSCMTVKN